MKKTFRRFLSLLLVVSLCLGMVSISAEAGTPTANHVVISQVYGGGGNSGAQYTNDFIELYNPTDSEVTLEGWSVQYAGKTQTFSDANKMTALSGSIEAHGYYLIQEKAGSSSFADLPTPDVIGEIAMAAKSGQVALVNSTTLISGISDGNVVDFIGYGNSTSNEANEYETAAAPTLSNSDAAVRKDSGVDTDDNSADFEKEAPNPRSSKFGTDTTCAVPTASPAAGSVLSGTLVTLDCGTAGATIYYTDDDTEPVIYDIGSDTNPTVKYTGSIEISGNEGETCTIKTIAVKDGLEDSTVATFEYTIITNDFYSGVTILPEGPDGTSIKDAYNLAKDDPVAVTGQVVYKPESDKRLAFLQGVLGDEIYGIAVYGESTVSDLVLGNVVTVTGKITIYNDMYEVTAVTDVQVIDSNTKLPSPQIVTIGELKADNAKYQNEYIRINGASLGTYNATGSTSFTQEGNSISTYKGPAYPNGLSADSIANITGIAYRYNSGYQLRLSDSGSYAEMGLVTIAEAKAAPLPTTNVKVSGVVTYAAGRNVYIQDETGAICLFLNASVSGLAEGDRVIASGTRANYSNLIEVSGVDESDITILSHGNDVPDMGTTTVAELIAQPAGKTAGYNHMCEIIKVEGATLTALDKLTQGGSEIKIYPTLSLSDFPGVVLGDIVDVTLRMYDYKGTLEVAISDLYKSSEKLAVTASPEAGSVISGTAVTLSCKDAKATIYYTANDTEPTINSMKYTGSIAISGSVGDTITISAIAVKGAAIGEIAKFAYTIQAPNPLVTAVTPVRNSATGENKTPEISVSLENAGTAPAVVMTLKKGSDIIVSGQAITLKEGETAVYAYTPATLSDGKYTATVTVTRSDLVSITESWNFTVGEAQYAAYFGQLHAHTAEYSDGSGSLQDGLNYFAAIPESDNVDFVSFTDHSNYFDSTSKANPAGALNDIELMTDASKGVWNTYVSSMEAFNSEHAGSLVALPGFEMTWSGGPGHINTFNSDGIISRNDKSLNNKSADAGMKLYYETLIQNTEPLANLSQFNHPGKTFGTFSDFAYWNQSYDNKMVAVEVGNGEGAIGSGGYFPSYTEYTKALDKGWHVAPTNNQDNHKGHWGNSNTCRTVILTDDLSDQGLLQGMKDMSVYSTEDKNLNISYTINDLVMGSILDDVPDEPLKIAVHVDDPDSGDVISKVEIVTNSGRVADRKTFDTSSADWEFELPAVQGYYYVRVTQADKNIAVTAPVWVGQAPRLGISSLECSTKMPVTGEEVTLTTTLFNNESSTAVLKSIAYSKGDTVLSAQTPGIEIVSEGTVNHTFGFTPDKAGTAAVSVTAVLTQNGIDKEYTSKINLNVRDSDKLVYVGIDASHYNEYVDGNYKDSMGNFANLAVDYDVRVVELETSDALIAATKNSKYQMLVLTPPTRRNGNAFLIDYKSYTDAEIAAVADFAASGGTVIVTSWGDYYEGYTKYSDGTSHSLPVDQHMAAQQNKLLSAIGTSLRVSDDEIKDNDNNGGQPQRLYLTNYNLENSFLAKVSPAEQVYSNYGGSTVYAVDENGQTTGTLLSSISPMVYAFETSYSSDDDKDNYAGVTIPKYDNKYMVAASETVTHSNGNTSTVIVAGSAFMSNFEIQADMDSYSTPEYSNYTILQNVLSKVNPVTLTDIADVQAAPEGKTFTIRGIATSNASGYNKDTAFFDCIYVQDDTAGINAFPVSGNIQAGQTVEIKGTTDAYNGERQIVVMDNNIKVIDDSIKPLPAAISETTAQAAEGANLGSMVTVTGTVTKFSPANIAVDSIYVKDSSGKECRVFIDGYITKTKTIANLAVGATLTATGLSSIDTEGARIRIRDRADIICTANQEGGSHGGGHSGGGTTKKPEAPAEQKPESANNGKNVVHTATVTGSLDSSTGTIKAEVSKKTVQSLIDEAKKSEAAGKSTIIEIKVDAPAPGKAVNVEISKVILKEIATGTKAKMKMETGLGSMTFSTKAMDSMNAAAAGGLNFSIAKVEAAELSETTRQIVGDRPVYDFSVKSGGRAISNFESNVEVSLPYTPTAGEDTNAIVVYYVDDSGSLKTARGCYDVSERAVNFVTTHFSKYMIGYNKVNFSDVSNTDWYSDAVSFIASRDITTGTDNSHFSPDASLSRGQFIVMLMRAYGISADENPSDNFTDAGGTYYTNYLSAAKRMGITGGIGNNRYAPEALITREDMFTLLYRALDSMKEVPEKSSRKELSDFADSDEIKDYAKPALQSFVESGILSGNDGNLNPNGLSNRAEMAQVLRNLLMN